jgi:protein O-mannosyl-transferase
MKEIFRSFRFRHFLILLFVITFLVYLPSFRNHFVWDDEQFITRNTFLTSFQYIPQIFTTNTIAGAGENSNYYRPLTTLSFLMDRHIWGPAPFGFHLTNTILHAIAAILLCIFLVEIGVGKKASWWMSLFFALHPLQTEAVVYMNSRGDSLYAVFLFLSLITFNRIFSKKSSQGMYGLASILFFVCAVLSKEVALGGIGLFGLLLVFHGVHRKLKIAHVFDAFPIPIYTFIGLLFCTVSYILLRLTVFNFKDILNFYNGTNLYTSNIFVRFLTFTRVFWEYLRLLLFPYPLHMERDMAIIPTPLNLFTIGFILFFLFFGYLGYREIKNKHTMWILTGLGWFLAMISIVSGIIPGNGILYEHWLYVPMVGIFLTLYGVGKSIALPIRSSFIPFLCTCLGMTYAVVTIRQIGLWHDPITFYTYTLQFADSARLHNNLAMAYAEEKLQPQAIEEYKKAIQRSDAYPQTHYNLARSYQEIGEKDKAIAEYKQALTLDPTFAFAYGPLINLLLETKNTTEAISYLQVLYAASKDPQVFDLLQQLQKKE